MIRFAIYFSIFYVIIIQLSAIRAGQLPSFDEIESNHAQTCYWIGESLAYVECGEGVFWREFFILYYKFWQKFIYYPFSAIFGDHKYMVLTIIIYSPPAYLIRLAIKTVRLG